MNKHIMLWALLACPLLGIAQTSPEAPTRSPTAQIQIQALQAAQAEAPVPAHPYQPLAPMGVSGLVSAQGDWKAVNATVGQYPRGHADIVKWERTQQAMPRTPTLEAKP